MAELKAQGVYGNTLIIVTSDNGANSNNSNFADHQGTGRLNGVDVRGRKTDLYEGGHRVPFIAHWGDDTPQGSVVPAGVVTNELISLQDFYRTMAVLLDVPLKENEGVDSWNILPVLFGNGELQRIREAQFSISIRGAYAIAKQYPDGSEWKLMFCSGSCGQTKPAGDPESPEQDFEALNQANLQLYNLTQDIGETNNVLVDGVSDAEQQILEELHGLLREYLTSETSTARAQK